MPIVYGGRSTGRVVLISKTGDLAARFLGVFVIGGLGALLAMGIGLFDRTSAAAIHNAPADGLSAEMARIAQTHDYSAAVPATADIETELLAGSFNVMMGQIRKASLALSNREAELIFRLSRATEKRDNETGGHHCSHGGDVPARRRRPASQQNETEAMHRVAPLHDVGKIAVPDSIMFKPGKLDPAERREMEQHTIYGYEILRDSELDLIRLAAEMAWSHHERWDGAGYPRGSEGQRHPAGRSRGRSCRRLRRACIQATLQTGLELGGRSKPPR